MPTVNCLVSLIDQPFFLISLDDIELAHFERVQFNLKNFDLTFIFKDYSRQPMRVSSISTHYLDPIKDWLDDINILYSESANALRWANVLKEITKDIEGFIEDGGWAFLQDKSESEGEQDGSEREAAPEEIDSDFKEEDASDSDASGVEDSDGESDDESSDSAGSDDSEGLDWDELEKIAKHSDAKTREKEKLRK
jgi:nucleosome binding factor SPN SPT16 subunit